MMIPEQCFYLIRSIRKTTMLFTTLCVSAGMNPPRRGPGVAFGAINHPNLALLAEFKTGKSVGVMHPYQDGRHNPAATSFYETL